MWKWDVDSFLLFHSSTTFTLCGKGLISFIENVFGEHRRSATLNCNAFKCFFHVGKSVEF